MSSRAIQLAVRGCELTIAARFPHLFHPLASVTCRRYSPALLASAQRIEQAAAGPAVGGQPGAALVGHYGPARLGADGAVDLALVKAALFEQHLYLPALLAGNAAHAAGPRRLYVGPAAQPVSQQGNS